MTKNSLLEKNEIMDISNNYNNSNVNNPIKYVSQLLLQSYIVPNGLQTLTIIITVCSTMHYGLLFIINIYIFHNICTRVYFPGVKFLIIFNYSEFKFLPLNILQVGYIIIKISFSVVVLFNKWFKNVSHQRFICIYCNSNYINIYYYFINFLNVFTIERRNSKVMCIFHRWPHYCVISSYLLLSESNNIHALF